MKRSFTLIFTIIFSSLFFSQELEVKWVKAAEGLSFPEGPAWNGSELYVSNCYSNWILRIKDEKADTFTTTPTLPINFEKTNGLTFYKDGNLFACDYGKGAILKFTPESNCEMVAAGYNGIKFNRPNDLAFDNQGNLFFTDPNSYDSAKLDGTIYMISAQNKEVRRLYTGLGFPNGIALTSDGNHLMVCESAMHRILKFPIKDDNTLGSPMVFAELPGGDPDGIAFDIEGNLYVAHFGGKAIYVFNPFGNLVKKIITPGKKPSNVEFGGNDMKTLFITEDETNAVYYVNVEIPGQKLFSSPEFQK